MTGDDCNLKIETTELYKSFGLVFLESKGICVSIFIPKHTQYATCPYFLLRPFKATIVSSKNAR